MSKSNSLLSYVWLAIGCVLFAFIGLGWNMPVAAWIAPVFLIRFFRTQERWPRTLIALPIFVLAYFARFHGVWGDLSLGAEIGFSALMAVPFVVALYVDRYTSKRVGGVVSTLVYPSLHVAFEFLLSLLPVGTTLSTAVTQFDAKPLLQIVSITGQWGIPFVVGWFAATANALWKADFDAKKAAWPVVVFVTCLVLVLSLGGLRMVVARPVSDTVRIAGVTVAHGKDYWAETIDLGTPRDKVQALAGEFKALEDRLFAESERAVGAGAQIVFWSEAAAMIRPEDRDAFMQRAQDFAQEHQVYFVPAMVVLKYGESYGENILAMITPEGELAYTYEKTKSWYQTDSDGVLHAIDTPYGRLSALICFDMDFPAFVNQAAKQDVDVMLVPAFDWRGIKAFHTQVGLMRAVENGFSAFRQVNEGTTMAVDYLGNVLATQDFFTASDGIVIADVPTQGVSTIYGALGDWFAYAAMLFSVGVVVWAVIKRRG